MVKAYLDKQDPFRLTGALSSLDSLALNQHINRDLLPAINSIAGVKMEERSPGSYRLSIRGSLLRSPFGIRNIKIYYDEIPLTDASGNTYLNLLDPVGIQEINVLKGPDGSLFGANSGGVVLLRPKGEGSKSSKAELDLYGGSFHYLSERASIDLQPSSKYRFALNEAYTYKKGYRTQSAMKHTFLQTTQRWIYRSNAELRFVGFYGDLGYETPGGLTSEQYKTDPRQARPSTSFGPGAVEQDAQIINKTLFGGFIHEFSPIKQLRNVTSVFASYTAFTNPFITNYETRKESNTGFRSWFTYSFPNLRSWNISMHLGVEWQQAWHTIRNFENLSGQKGERQEADKLLSNQHFYFARLSADWHQRLLLELSTSLNHYSYKYQTLFPVSAQQYTPIQFSPEWMPRLGLSYLINPSLAIRYTVSKGYSVPTISEIRASNRTINTALKAEKGWNHEFGARWSINKLAIDLAAFNFKMNNAIIREVNAEDEEFFKNTGGINQHGLEASIHVNILDKPQQWLSLLSINSAVAISDFRFNRYQSGAQNWSGNQVTGIPKLTHNTLLSIGIKKKVNFNLWHIYQSRTPLDDANINFADAYHLIQTKLTWDLMQTDRFRWTLWGAVDNVLNVQYSLGNDINAYGNRFYNPAPSRNFSIGARLILL